MSIFRAADIAYIIFSMMVLGVGLSGVVVVILIEAGVA